MSESKAPRLEGLIVEAHTPFAASGRYDAGAVTRQAELYEESGVNGVFLAGTAGEGQSLTLAERRALLETWVGVTEGRTAIVAHIGHNSVRDAVDLARHANDAGATAIAAMATSYHQPTSLEDLIEYLASVAEAAPDIPFLYYDAEHSNGALFPTDQVLEWGRMRIPTLAGVNFDSGDLAAFGRCLRLGDRFDVLLGQEELLLPALASGARGAVGVTFNFAAPLYRRILDAFRVGDMETARAEEAKALRLARVLRDFGVVRASKAIMSLLGVNCGGVRLPLRPLSDPEFRALHERVRTMDVFARSLSTPAEIGR